MLPYCLVKRRIAEKAKLEQAKQEMDLKRLKEDMEEKRKEEESGLQELVEQLKVDETNVNKESNVRSEND